MRDLTFDLDARSLNHLRLGSPVDSIRTEFGRPDNDDARRRTSFQYRSSGLEIDIEGDTVTGAAFVIVDAEERGYTTCRASLTGSGFSRFPLSPRTTIQDFEEQLGTAEERNDYDEGHCTLFFYKPQLSLSVDFDARGQLTHVQIFLEDE